MWPHLPRAGCCLLAAAAGPCSAPAVPRVDRIPALAAADAVRGPRPGLRADEPISAPVPAPDPAPSTPPVLPEPACAADGDCGYQPDRDRCAADPRANRQPVLTDQGVVCYCDDASHRCAALRVLPVPCESDASCAVSLDPRPHPVAADAAHLHARGRPCRDFTLTTTCEHTNLCTLCRPPCPAREGAHR